MKNTLLKISYANYYNFLIIIIVNIRNELCNNSCKVLCDWLDIPSKNKRLIRNYGFDLKTMKAVKMPSNSICCLAF